MSRRFISKNALKVLYRLNDSGYQAYLVGGGVRDILLGMRPKDFDVVTDATPEQIKKLFGNCRLIGRRFRLAHIVFGRDIIEVATFRGHHETNTDKVAKQSEHGQLLRDNVYGSIDEDAERRDFSINALYYNIADHSIRDYCNGVEAINNRKIELIGDPETRYREDPVRMLRAVRFAVKLDMDIAESTAAPILPLADLLQNIPSARLFEECLKLFMSGQGLATYTMLKQYNLAQQIFAPLASVLSDDASHTNQLFCLALKSTDQRIAEDKRVTPAFLFATLYWDDLQAKWRELQTEGGLNSHDAIQVAINETLDNCATSVMIPKRFAAMIRDIWQLQPRLEQRHGQRPFKLLEHPKFRAAYDFLLLRAEVYGGHLTELAQWWTDFQAQDENQQRMQIASLNDGKRDPSQKKRRRRTNRRRKPQSKQDNS